MITALISRLIILVFGNFYPAYASYKAVRSKSVKDYVKWMMYWIVFALFTCIETFTDIFVSWFPFYYEIKVLVVLWLLSPATRGSSILYRKFVHPILTKREQDIDSYIHNCKEKGYSTFMELGSKGVNYATNVLMQTALKKFQIGSIESEQRMLTNSVSEPSIPTTRRPILITEDVPDGRAFNYMPRSQTMGTIRTVIFSEEEMDVRMTNDVDQIDEDILEEIANADNGGAARSRAPPIRKTKPKRKTKKDSSDDEATCSKNIIERTGIRTRRGLRETTPDVYVIIE